MSPPVYSARDGDPCLLPADYCGESHLTFKAAGTGAAGEENHSYSELVGCPGLLGSLFPKCFHSQGISVKSSWTKKAMTQLFSANWVQNAF